MAQHVFENRWVDFCKRVGINTQRVPKYTFLKERVTFEMIAWAKDSARKGVFTWGCVEDLNLQYMIFTDAETAFEFKMRWM